MKKPLKRLNLVRVTVRNLDELRDAAGGGNNNTVGDCVTTKCFSDSCGGGSGGGFNTADCSLWLA